MQTLRILQLSDLLIDTDGYANALDKIKNRAEQFRKESKFAHFDYLVVCGNTTTDGTHTQFEKAKTILEDLKKTFLPPKQRETGDPLRRIMVVPGTTDRNKINGFAEFEKFHADLYSPILTDSTIEDRFSENSITFRQLKELTLIGTCCFEDTNTFINSLADFKSNIEHWKNEGILDLDYTQRTPTLLVSSDSFQIKWHVASSLAESGSAEILTHFKALEEFLNEKLTVTLHLFGSGPIPWQPPQPFGLDYPALGTGYRLNRELWPLSFNVISINVEESADQIQDCFQPLLQIHAFHRRVTGDWWEPEKYAEERKRKLLDHHLTVATSRPTRLGVFQSLLDKISNRIINKKQRTLLVHGLAGSGIQKLFEILSETKNLAGGKILILDTIELSSYPKGIEDEDKDFDYWIGTEVKRLTAKAKTIDSLETEVVLLVVILDLLFSESGYKPTFENSLSTTIKQFFSRIPRISHKLVQSKSRRDVCVLYLVEAALSNMPDFRSDNENYIPLGDLGDHFKQLMKQYAAWTPIQSATLARLTGQYMSFSETILKTGLEAFQRYSGTCLVDKSTCHNILSEALGRFRGESSVSYLVNHINQLAKNRLGVQFSVFIERVFRRIEREEKAKIFEITNKNVWYRAPIELRLQEIAAEVASLRSSSTFDAQIIIDQLVDYSILKRLGDGRYELQVLAPFLITRDGWGRKKFVYIAYPKEYLDHAKMAYVSISNNDHHAFMDEIDKLVGVSWDDLLSKMLLTSDRLVLFCSKESEKATRYLQKEVQWAHEWWRELNDAVASAYNYIAVVKLDDCSPPDWLDDSHRVTLDIRKDNDWLKALNDWLDR